ncbi:clavin precursor [Pyronema domesticum]|uniref:Similar to Ribonuclease clavin acc. no. P0CL71 n=1 Tax=Pyronema omphalodes (strain CBS 100304) TaxID=1076935 RepID=U4KU86_PYROM|nr:clavin precursor [Pyronema domesticum]CCX04823.1 Similar to Ribonuclease clavin; acc. no. P0CL71 [Pyronema omphalodes CBS 100304]
MVSLKTFLCAVLLAAPALAAPTADPTSLEALEARAEKEYRCKNEVKDFLIKESVAVHTVRQAPVTKGGTKSGYPHPFQNFSKIKWANKKCNTGSGKGGREPPLLLEFPVFADGHFYPYNTGKPKPDPGNNRVIYSYPNKDFCGVVGHTKKNNGGPLAHCT